MSEYAVQTGHIFQINRSDGGVPKLPVARATVTAAGLAGDRQRDRRHHGGAERALCLYALERIVALQAEGHPVYPGAMGENVTVAGLEWADVVPGSRLQLGPAVVVEVTGYAAPCRNIQACFAAEAFTRASQKLHPGWSRVYARVVKPGDIGVGDVVALDGA